MTSKERVYKALQFDKPDRVPVDIWMLPAVEERYGKALEELVARRNIDVVKAPFHDPTADAQMYDAGIHHDIWGCEWHSHKAGMAGEVKGYPLEKNENFEKYRSPVYLLEKIDESEFRKGTQEYLDKHSDKFVYGGWISLFERMQFLRGTEELYVDIALESDEFFLLRDMVLKYWLCYADLVSQTPGVDACIIGDDWGSQKSLLISPEAWRKLFKPAYKQIIDRIRSNGKLVFVHSDGYILDLYKDWIELGVSAINSQVWCMGVDAVAKETHGKITCWGELSRQSTLPFGTPEDILREVAEMKEKLSCNGGLIGQCEVGCDVPLINIETALFAW